MKKVDCAAKILKQLKTEQVKLAKVRDSLRMIQDELDMQVESCEEGYELLDECIDRLSELV